MKYSEAFQKKFARALDELGKDANEPIFSELARMEFNKKQKLPDGIQAKEGGADEDIPEIPPHVKQQLREFQEMNNRLVRNGEFNPRQYLNRATNLAISNIQNFGNLPTLALQRIENNYGTLSSLGINSYARTVSRFAGDKLVNKVMADRFEGAFRLLEVITSDDPFSEETLNKFCEFGTRQLSKKIDDKVLGKIPESFNSSAFLGDAFVFLAQENGISFAELTNVFQEYLDETPCYGMEAVTELINGVETQQGLLGERDAIYYMLNWTEVCNLPKGFKAPAYDYQYNKRKYHDRFSKDWVAGGNVNDISGYVALPDGMKVVVKNDYANELAPYELKGGNIYLDRVNVKCVILNDKGDRRIVYVPWNLDEELTITSTSPYVECRVEPFSFDFSTDHDLQAMVNIVTFDYSYFEFDTEDDEFRGGVNKQTEHQRSFREFDFGNIVDREFGLYYTVTNLSTHGKSQINTLHSGWWNPVYQSNNPKSVFLYEFELKDLVSELPIEIGKPNGEKQKIKRHPLPLMANNRIDYKLSIYDPVPHSIYNPSDYPSSDKVPKSILLDPRSHKILHRQIKHNTQVRVCTLYDYVAEEPVYPYGNFYSVLHLYIAEALLKGHRFQCDQDCWGGNWLGNSGPPKLIGEDMFGSGGDKNKSGFNFVERYFQY
ncbi:MAG: hypothetical protein ACK4E0_19225 [Chitinophagaceae bacterium]